MVPDVTSEPVSNPTPESATFTRTVNPDGAGEATCRFVWGTSTAFGQVAPCSSPVTEGSNPVPVHAALSGLEPDTIYHYRLQASNASGTNQGEESEDQEFRTPGPGIHSESVSNVASTSATLGATIDPDGAPTTYYFQYGAENTEACSGNPSLCATAPAAPGTVLGAGNGDVEAPEHVQGLSPGMTYHYRVIAVSELAEGIQTFAGEDHAFTTQSVGAPSGLPDGRQWEISPSPTSIARCLPGSDT